MLAPNGVDRVRGAVQDMVDGEEAQAAWEAGSAATTSELAGFTCPQGTALVESITVGDPGGVVYFATCWNISTKQIHGPVLARFPDGHVALQDEFVEGENHGLSFEWSHTTGHPFRRANCWDNGSSTWDCWPPGGNAFADYECSSPEEAEALAAQIGCP